jgi:hypothetical protein
VVKAKESREVQHDEEGKLDGYTCQYTLNGSVVLKLDVFVWHGTDNDPGGTVDDMVEQDYRAKNPVSGVGDKAILCTSPGQPGRIVVGKMSGDELRVLNFRTVHPVPDSALIEVGKVVMSHL